MAGDLETHRRGTGKLGQRQECGVLKPRAGSVPQKPEQRGVGSPAEPPEDPACSTSTGGAGLHPCEGLNCCCSQPRSSGTSLPRCQNERTTPAFRPPPPVTACSSGFVPTSALSIQAKFPTPTCPSASGMRHLPVQLLGCAVSMRRLSPDWPAPRDNHTSDSFQECALRYLIYCQFSLGGGSQQNVF